MRYIFLAVCCVLCLFACRKTEIFPDTQLDERMSGGLFATAFDESSGAYGNVISGLTYRQSQVHDIGNTLFETPFVTAPAPKFAGLGPLFNQTSCVRCHTNEGRGIPQLAAEPMVSMFFKISLSGTDLQGAPLPVPQYGLQLQDKAIAGYTPEAKISTHWQEREEVLGDGTIISLRKPEYTFSAVNLPDGCLLSPRVARPSYGVGLIEAISEESILLHADPDDRNDDGISGKPNYVWDYVNNRGSVLGRIGWKASVPSIKAQVVKALELDMGIYPEEIHDTMVNALTFYVQTIGVPARRNIDAPQVQQGKALFASLGCIKCHVDKQITRVNVAMPPLSGQTIRPYSDFLLHDMGSDLADGYSEFSANGQEWRTPPLWGIGLTQKVSGHTNFLHDGRARSLTEAILWHGGEAGSARYRFSQLSAHERAALIAFLESL